jgi:hypothetical protein
VTNGADSACFFEGKPAFGLDDGPAMRCAAWDFDLDLAHCWKIANRRLGLIRPRANRFDGINWMNFGQFDSLFALVGKFVWCWLISIKS